MELKDTIIGMIKRVEGQKRHERRETAEYAGFQVSSTCFSWVAAVTKALIRFLADFSGVFMCVCVSAGGQRKGEEFKNEGVAFANHSQGVHQCSEV